MKHLLIAGGAAGIGAAIVRQQAAEGHALTVTSRDPAAITPAPGVTPASFDATAPEHLPALPEVLDGFVYCPGTILLKPFQRSTRDDFQSTLEVNLLGAVSLLQAALPSLNRAPRASVVLFSTVAAGTGFGFHACIAAAKGAVEGLARALAAEWAPKIRVNVIAPSLTDTPLASTLLSTPEKQAAAAARHPLKTIGQPEEAAALAGFLLSDASLTMTGQVLRPDGGLSSVRVF